MNVRTLVAPNPGPYTLDGTRTYVLDEGVVIDPGPEIGAHVEAILAAAPALHSIFVTHRHRDHAPAAESLRARTGAKVYAPAGIVPAPDHPLRDGETFPCGALTLEVIATPGHTGEHVCFLTSEGDLFTGDTVLGEGTTTIFLPDGDMASYLASLRRLRERAPRRIYPGHGPVRDDATALLDYYLEHRLSRESEIVAQLAIGTGDIPDLRRRIYPDLHPALHRAAELQIEAHLEKLAREGRVRHASSAWSLT